MRMLTVLTKSLIVLTKPFTVLTKSPAVFLALLVLFLLLPGCTLLRKASGTYIDRDAAAKAREARMLEVRYESALRLSEKLLKEDETARADILLYLEEKLFNDILSQLKGLTGKLDARTNYTVRSVSIDLHHGSAIAALNLFAVSESDGVEMNLLLDCLLALRVEKDELVAVLEPFNITPEVIESGWWPGSKAIVQDIATMELSRLGETFPRIAIPMNLRDEVSLGETDFIVKGKPSTRITTSWQKLEYSLKLKAVMVFENALLVALDIGEVKFR